MRVRLVAVGMLAACAVAAAPASATIYNFTSFQGNKCTLTTANSAAGFTDNKTIKFSSSFVCQRQMDQIGMGSKLTNGTQTWNTPGAGCLYPTCGTTPLTASKTLYGMKSGAYAHETDVFFYLTYTSRDFWITADERAACTYTQLSATSSGLKCTLIEPIVA